MTGTCVRTIGAAAVTAALLAGCSPSMPGHAGMASPASSSTSEAATLRAGLNALFAEHVYLASAATGAALGGREAEFRAAANALDANSVAIAQSIGSVYGKDAEAAFLPLWRRHIGMVVDYTVGVATGDRAKQDKAVSDLLGYTQDLGAFLAAANPHLPKQVLADLVRHHVVTLKDVIDAQAAKDHARAWAAARAAAAHMRQIADPLAEAIVKQFPDRYRAWRPDERSSGDSVPRMTVRARPDSSTRGPASRARTTPPRAEAW